MRKYKIVGHVTKDGECYTVQRKLLFFWFIVGNCEKDYYFNTKEEAEDYIKRAKKIERFNKKDPPK